MVSLKAFLPTLSRFVELSPSALYERQRALVRLGLLPTPKATGRNSGGAMAKADSVATLLLAVLVTDNLSEMDARIASLANKHAVDASTGEPAICHITGRTTLLRALAAALANPNMSTALGVEVSRKSRTARLVNADRPMHPSVFGRGTELKGIEVIAKFAQLFELSRHLEEFKA